jgi:hypothetical protein
MTLREHGYKRLRPEHLGAETSFVHGRSQEADVEAAVEESCDLSRGQQLAAEIEDDPGSSARSAAASAGSIA